ncbi:Exocyst complex component S5 [Coemansia erecta]|uniref:Exocyst complex component SEC5 n=1 Tax=Coemansia erecta TaxID=147472 RepID=A0A9W7Y598_9FUNG|nr:Exocyst complex component S5 [Coemansia erecta]
MPPIDDAEILARYGLDSFANTAYGHGDDGASDMHSRGRSDKHGDMSQSRDGSSRGRRSRRSRGSYGGGGDGYADVGDVDDDDDEDDDDERRFRDSVSGNGATAHSLAISDRDPLHVYQSVAAVLENKGDANALGDMAYRAKFSVSNKSFSPPMFMQVVHSDTSYGDLVQGARLLRESVSQGTEALKILVHNNFDRFVDARNKIDLLYGEMKTRSLNEEAEYGTRAFSQSLQGATQKADDIYNPIIDRRARAEKIRSTLSVVERYKFYFNLPSSLIDYTRKGKFDVAVREYKKGRQLLQAVTNGNIDGIDEVVADGSQSNALSKIFQYVWKEVQESVIELRNALFKHLSQPWRPYSEQENVIRYLLEIDPGERDPVGYYLEQQHTWIVEQMDTIYKGHKQRIQQTAQQQSQAERRRTISGMGISTGSPTVGGTPRDSLQDTERRADELSRALKIESFAEFPAFSHGRDAEFHKWKQTYNALRTLSQTLVRCLPDFWKLSQAYMEELYRKPEANGGGRRRHHGINLEKVSKCHSLLEGIIERYSQFVLRLTGVLGETDTIVSLESLDGSNIGTTLQRVPQTHALLAGHFMTAIMELVVNTANDIEAIDMAQEPAIILANLISQLKAGLTLFLCEMWDRDAQFMSLHENWCLHHGTSYWPPFYISRRDRQTSEDSSSAIAESIANTELLPLFLRTTQTILGQLNTIHSATLQPGKSTRSGGQGHTPHFDANFDEEQRQQSARSHEMHDMAAAHFKHTFFGTMLSFLDTLHALAFNTLPQTDAYGATSFGFDERSGASSVPISPTSAQIPSFGVSGLVQSPQVPSVRSSVIARRLSFNMTGKSDSSSSAGSGRRHSMYESGRLDQAKTRNQHSSRSFFVLATLSNLTAFRMFVVPDLLHSKAVRYAFKLEVSDELPKLEKMIRRLDEMIFSFYIRDKSKQLSSIVHRGVLLGGFSWSTTELPKDTQPYVSEALLYLVFTHAEIMDLISELGAGAEHHMVKQQPLTKRVFQVLTVNLTQDLLESVRAIDTFSVGGMLQCVLETLVITQTLQMYLTAPANECLRLLHNYVRSVFDRTQDRAKRIAAQQGRPMPDQPAGQLREIDGVVLAGEHWDIVHKLLSDCTRRTQIQFRCFQRSSSTSP